MHQPNLIVFYAVCIVSLESKRSDLRRSSCYLRRSIGRFVLPFVSKQKAQSLAPNDRASLDLSIELKSTGVLEGDAMRSLKHCLK
jgi:hypothetical protein